VARFERHQPQVGTLPAPLESAAEELESTIERQIVRVLEAAQARAQAIENEAEHTADEIVQDVFSRASRVIDSIELVQSALNGMVIGLREELDSMVANQQSERAADALAQGRQLRLPADQGGGTTQERPALEPEPQPEPEAMPRDEPQGEAAPDAPAEADASEGAPAEPPPGPDPQPPAEAAPAVPAELLIPPVSNHRVTVRRGVFRRIRRKR
jgi:hypothetical protein